jgi:peptidoglycan/LPS O-acetylase OafA/YrhL
MSDTRPTTYDSLTGLRGLASIWVTLGHLTMFDGLLLSNAGLGVDVFFVLSGFILAHAHARDFAAGLDARTIKRFIGLRLARIYPLHAATTLALMPMTLLPGFLERFHPNAFSMVNLAANALLVHTWTFFFLPAEYLGPGWSWNGPSWSLSVEWLLYLIFPFLIWMISRTDSCALLALCAVGSLVGMVALLSLSQGKLALGTMGKSGFLQGGAEFVCGIVIYFLRAKSVEFREFTARWCTVSAGVFVALAMMTSLHPLSIFTLIIMVPGLAAERGIFAILCSSGPVKYLGEISFSLYLCHMPIILLWNFMRHRMDLEFDGIALILANCGVLAAILATSHVSFYALERPARALGRRLVARMAH